MSKVSRHRRTFGQFFTPQPVVACCYALLRDELPATVRLVDPACGDGAFLRYALAQAIGAPDDLLGCDVDAELVGALLAAGLGGVRVADGLDSASLPAASFDLVIGNPPFGIATPWADQRPSASEVRFLLRAVELARPGGLIALVLPSGVLANERLQATRGSLIERCTVLAVVALPRDTFREAGTRAACSILLLRNTPPAPGHQVFFAAPQQVEDLPAVVVAYHERPGAESQAPLGDPLAIAGERAAGYWLAQTPALSRRLDAPFWRPDQRALLEQVAARHALRPLGELIDRRQALIVGDHVRPSRGEARGPGLPYEYYQTREFMAAGYNYALVERCDERAYRRLRRTAVRRHDVLVSCAGVGGAGRGRVCLVTHQPGPSCTGDVFILRTAWPDPIFLFLFLGAPAGRAQILRLQNGVGTANLSADELLQIEVPLLPEAGVRDIVAGYASIATAHDAAMAALARGDVAGFSHARERSEALLDNVRRALDTLLWGE
jgi:predicted RNA methylase